MQARRDEFPFGDYNKQESLYAVPDMKSESYQQPTYLLEIDDEIDADHLRMLYEPPLPQGDVRCTLLLLVLFVLFLLASSCLFDMISFFFHFSLTFGFQVVSTFLQLRRFLGFWRKRSFISTRWLTRSQ